MTTAFSRKPAFRGPRRRQGDDGFVLLETLVSIGLIGVVMAAFTMFFINSVAFTSQQRATQIATSIANSAVDTIRAMPASDLPVDGAVGAVPTTQTVNNVVYRVVNSITACVIPAGMTQGADCGSPSVGGTPYLRASVMVTWAGTRCPPTQCAFMTSTLLSAVDDPLFNPNQAPPPAPVLSNPGAQLSAIGDSINLPATITAAPSYSVAVTSGSLPAGLILTPATGLISGTPSALTSAAPVTLTLTDGFGRATTATFTWTVVAALVTTAPPGQASFIGTALSLTLPAATGGTPGYTWSDPGSTLPPGLTLSTVRDQATITGTPTTRGVYPVTLTVTDSTTTRKSTVGFSWTTDYPPMVATNPGPQKSTVGTSDSVTVSVTGGSGSFVWAGGGTLPAGLTLSSTGVVSGTPSAAGVTSVGLQVSDTVTALTRNVLFNWTVDARPTVTAPADQTTTVGRSVSFQLATTCPNAPCSYVLNNGPATLGISDTGLLTGTVTSARPPSAASITVIDSAGATATSAEFTVTVNAAPAVANPGNQTAVPGSVAVLDVTGLVTGGTAPLRYSASNLPSWLALDTSTGRISGTAPGRTDATTGIILTVTDARGVTGSSPAFSWSVGGPPSAPLAVTVVNGNGAVMVTWTAPSIGPVTSYTATVSPGGASCTTASLGCVVKGLTDGVGYSVTVTATNSLGTGPASAAAIGIPYPALMSSANGMTAWLDGADPTFMFAGSACTGAAPTATIGCWKDKSLQGNNFVQAAVGSQPGIRTWNGLPAADFADSGEVLTSINASGRYQTVFVAANVTNAAGSKVVVDLFGQAGADFNVRIGSGTSRGSPTANDWSSNTVGPLNWANGAQGAEPNVPLAVITTDQAGTVQTMAASVSNTFAGRGVVGQVGEVITFSGGLTTVQRRSVEEYLSRKWGVAITPAAPTSVTGIASGPNAADVSWAAPMFNGGTGVTGYTVTSTPGGKSCTTAGLSCTVHGLPKDISYTFTVTAANAIGVGPASAPSNPVNP